MAIAFVKNGGVAANKAGGITTIAVTVPAGGHAAGNTVVAAVTYLFNSTPRSVGITDTRGNTWTLIEVGSDFGIAGCAILASKLTTALVAGDTITAGITGGSGVYNKSAITTAEFSGLSITESGTSAYTLTSGGTTAPSVGPVTPADAATLMIGVIGLEGPTGDTFTQDSDTAGGAGWSAGPVAGTTGGSAPSNMTARMAYKITTSAVAQTYNPTLGTSRGCYISLASLVATATGTAWTQPVNDTLSLSDLVATQAGKTASIPDTVGVADQLTSQAAFSRTIPDTVAVADAQTVAREIAQAIVDTLSLADSTALVRDIAQAIVDTVGLADLAATAAGKGATVNDTVAVADAVRFDQALTVADTVALGDVVAQAEEIHIADTLAVTDLCDPVKTTGAVGHTQPVADTVSVADALLFNRTQTLTDTVAVTDALASQAALSRTLADTVAMADTLAYSATLLRTIADTVGVADSVAPVKSSGAVDWAQPITDTVTVADQIAYQAALARTIADTVALSDATQALRGLTHALVDTLTVADQLASLTERNLQLGDTIGLTDLVASQADLLRLLEDSVFIADELFSESVIPTPLPAGWITFAAGNRIGVLYPGRLDTAAQTLGGITVPGQGEGELALTGVGGIARTGG